ncbi:MAG TPA: response regulator transcription factor [Thermoanaerobaculia bacterium]|nr:response regulator transcription factor [Thermoanaerobaculia bacterium]
MKLLVGSDDPIVRKGFCEIVRARAGWAVVSEAGTIAELIAHAQNGGGADVIVVDLPLGEHSGTEAVAGIRAAAPTTPLLILAPYAEEHYAPAFFHAGANGFVRRSAEPEEILEAIAAIARGRNYRSAPADRPQQPHELLSGRELEVFRYLAAGRKPTDIAAVMNLSIKTVSTYRARILEKTGFQSNADIVGYAIRTGMLG